jgi:hypothetical protein
MKFILLIAIAIAVFMYYKHNKRKQQRIVNMNYVIQKYGNDIWLLVDSKQLYKGMPKELVTIGWGTPQDVVIRSDCEGWYYNFSSDHIFFVDGVVYDWSMHS